MHDFVSHSNYFSLLYINNCTHSAKIVSHITIGAFYSCVFWTTFRIHSDVKAADEKKSICGSCGCERIRSMHLFLFWLSSLSEVFLLFAPWDVMCIQSILWAQVLCHLFHLNSCHSTTDRFQRPLSVKMLLDLLRDPKNLICNRISLEYFFSNKTPLKTLRLFNNIVL